MATMTSLLTILLASLQAAAASVSLPRPHLHVDYAATVLHLQCSPPTEAAGVWLKILSVAVSRTDTHRNATVMSIADGQAAPLLGEFLQGRSSTVQALGSLDDKTIKLFALFPTTNDTIFTCDIVHLLNDRIGSFTFSRTLDVTQFQGGEFRNYDFEYRTIHAHNISIEWSSGNLPQHGQLTVSRIPRGRDGQQVEAQQILLALDARRGDLSTEDVIIVDFKPTYAVGNASLTVFVASSTCNYDCYIPHNHCYDQDEKLCHCQPEDDRPACSVAEVYLVLLCVFLALWISTLIPTITLCCCLSCKRRKLFREIVKFVKCSERPNAKPSEEQPALGPEDAEEDSDAAEKKSDKERRNVIAWKEDTNAQLSVDIPNHEEIETPDPGRGQRDSRGRRTLELDSYPGRQAREWPSGSLGRRRVDDGGPVADRNSGARPRSRTSETGPGPQDIPRDTKHSRSVAASALDPNHTRDYPGSSSASANGSSESHLDRYETLATNARSKRSSQGSTESTLNPESLKRSLNTDLRDPHNANTTTVSTPMLSRPTVINGSGETDSDHALRDKH